MICKRHFAIRVASDTSLWDMLATLRYTICKRDIAIRFASDTSLWELQAPSPPRYTIYPHTFHYHVLPCHPPPNRFPAHSIQNLPKQPKPRDMMQAMLIRWRSSASERSLCDAYFFHEKLSIPHSSPSFNELSTFRRCRRLGIVDQEIFNTTFPLRTAFCRPPFTLSSPTAPRKLVPLRR